jgi:8-oxo-dGTP pyrophosphatase MutT (NUDIX family)
MPSIKLTDHERLHGGLPAWRTLASKIVVSNDWLSLRADTCETAEGVRIDPFYVIETSDVVLTIALTHDRELVLVRQYRHGFGATTLEFPAGRMEKGEDPVAASQRELLEETGYSGCTARLLHSLSPDTLRNTNRLYVVVIEDVEKTAEPKDDPVERLETRLWPLAEHQRLYLEPEFVHSSQVGAFAICLAMLEAETRTEPV